MPAEAGRFSFANSWFTSFSQEPLYMWENAEGLKDPAARLVARLKREDPAAQRRFWRICWPQVYADCARILGDGLPAHEVAVEVLSDFLLRYVHGLSHPGAAGTYLRLMAVRRAAREKEARSASKSVDMDVFHAEAGVDAEESAWAKALLPRLEECLGELTPKARQVLKLRYHADLTNERIGALLGGSKQYIGRLITRSLGVLRKCLERSRGPLVRRRPQGGVRP
jgi:RNA polymerase sigma-70 factor (ECF subfamily)